jgi:GNAT superfamily N-acetyltransferase
MMLIRKASAKDWSIIADFQQQMAWETENITLKPDIIKEGIQTIFNDPTKGSYYVAEVDNCIVGSLMITFEWSDWRNKLIYWIQSVYVLPEFRRRGIYRSLYEHIKSIASNANDVGGIRLYVDRSNLPAQKTYAKLGMNGEHYQVFEWMKLDE